MIYKPGTQWRCVATPDQLDSINISRRDAHKFSKPVTVRYQADELDYDVSDDFRVHVSTSEGHPYWLYSWMLQPTVKRWA